MCLVVFFTLITIIKLCPRGAQTCWRDLELDTMTLNFRHDHHSQIMYLHTEKQVALGLGDQKFYEITQK